MTGDHGSARVRLEPMTWDDFDLWSAHSVRGFAAQQVAAGLLAPPDAAAISEELFAELLPDGLATPTHLFWTVRGPTGDTAGYLWLRVRPAAGEPGEVEAYVFDVEIVPGARGRGLGRATMLAAEDAARQRGATVIRLNVFGHNTAALALYDRLGYAVSAASLSRRLDAEPAVATTPEDVRLLPEGPATAGPRIWAAYAGDDRVGRVELRVEQRSDGLHAFGREMVLAEQPRRYAGSLVLATERACRELGAVMLTITTVPGAAGAHDDRAVYEQAGYRLTAQTREKPV